MPDSVGDHGARGAGGSVRRCHTDARKRAAVFIGDVSGDGTVAALRKCGERQEKYEQKKGYKTNRFRVAHAGLLA